MRRVLLVAALATLGACHLGLDGGIIQRSGDRFGASGGAHAGIGGAGQKILVLDVDMRGDVGDHNSRFVGGASFLGGVPLAGGVRLMGRAGIWKAVGSSTEEATVVPTFELGVYIPTREDPGTPHDRMGPGPMSEGVYVGVRDDIDTDNYVTVFVGWSFFIVPGP